MEDPLNILDRDLLGLAKNAVAGDVGEKVDAAKLAVEPFEEAPDGNRVRGVTDDRRGASSMSDDDLRRARKPLCVPVDQQDIRAMLRKRDRGCAAHAARRSRYHGHSSGEVESLHAWVACVVQGHIPSKSRMTGSCLVTNTSPAKPR